MFVNLIVFVCFCFVIFAIGLIIFIGLFCNAFSALIFEILAILVGIKTLINFDCQIHEILFLFVKFEPNLIKLIVINIAIILVNWK